MQSLPPDYRALVIGASGAIGGAITHQLQSDPRCAQVFALSRTSTPAVDLLDESSIVAAAQFLRDQAPLHLIIIATGVLHNAELQPERRLSQLSYAHMLASFRINTLGPALLIAQLTPLLARQERSLFGVLSAKVGSISDNRLGGWYSYRASKAALNMIVKTAAIELARSHPHALLAALHPGTVESALSAPFSANHRTRPAQEAATELLQVLDQLPEGQSGTFRAYDGEILPW